MLTRSKKRSSDGNNSVDAHVKEKKQKKDQEQSPVQFNAMRMQQNQTNNETIAETPNATQSPENDIHDSINSAELLSCYNAIQKVLTLKYVNANERLKLSFPAKCTQALMECSQNHTRNAKVTMSDNITITQTLLKNDQPLLFIHTITMDVLQATFPSNSAIQSLFEMILSINEPSSGEYEVANVIDMAAFTIGKIFETFPPCWLAANAKYRELINTKKKNLITGSNDFMGNRTLFADILHGLESVIQPLATSSVTVISEDISNDSLNDSLHFMTFSQWESKNAQRFSFGKVKREDRIDRLFITLSLFVQLFETDLALWTMRNIRKPSAKIHRNDKNPLISLVLWDDEPHQVNFCIKNILKLYVTYININFSREHIKVLTRFVNLIFNIFDLCEMRLFKEKLEYPSPLQNQSQFCDSFSKIIFDIVGCNICSWLKIIETIQHPKLKLYLITALLMKIDHKNVTLNPKNIYFSMKKTEKLFNDDDFDETVGQNNNNVDSSSSKANAEDVGDTMMKYPCLKKVDRRAASGELSFKQQVKLHLIALNAYMNVFHIREFKHYWENYDELEKQKIKDLENLKKGSEIYKSQKVKPFDLKALGKLQQKSFNIRVKQTGKNNPICSLDVTNEAVGLAMGIVIQVDVRKYRDDVKFFDMIATGIPKLNAKFGAFFPKYSTPSQ